MHGLLPHAQLAEFFIGYVPDLLSITAESKKKKKVL
jgi:hypothetical protein